MQAIAESTPVPERRAGSRLLRAGLLTAAVDGLFSSVLSVAFYDSTVTELFQYVASTVMGAAAFEGGAPTALVGVIIHVGVAFAWSAVLLLVVMRIPRARALLDSWAGVVVVACVYGPFVWLAMSLIVIPLLTGSPTSFGVRWWVQLIGHAPFVGLPIAASFAGAAASQDQSRAAS